MHQPAPRTPPGNARQQKRTEYRLLFVQQPLKTTTNGTFSMPLAQAFDEHSGDAIFVFVVTARWRH